MNMKILQPKKLAVLGSLFVILSCKGNLIENKNLQPQSVSIKEVDKFQLLSAIKKDIEHLLNTQTEKGLDSEIFGDCIYYYLNKNASLKILKEDVIKDFNKIFDNNFRNNYIKKLSNENIQYVNFYSSKGGSLEKINELQNLENITVSFTIPIKDSEYDSSKMYWFRFDGEKWIFTGLTCTG